MKRVEAIRQMLESEVAVHPESGDHVILTLRGYDLRALLDRLERAEKLLRWSNDAPYHLPLGSFGHCNCDNCKEIKQFLSEEEI